jgi:hypothetical protein
MRSTTIAVLAGLALAAGCAIIPAGGSQIAVRTKAYPWVDLAAERTWAWAARPASLPRLGTDEQAQLVDWRVRQAVERGMASRGYVQASDTTADLLVTYRIAVTDASTDTVSGYLEYRAQGGTGDMGDAFVGYERGTLTIEMWERTSQRIAWRGAASAVVHEDGSGERVDAAVAKLLAELPAAGGG